MSYSATLSCSLLLLGISGLPSLSSASGLKLQRAHPLFGKCTASDLGEPTPISGTSFLQEVSNPHSHDECLNFMSKEGDSFISAALKFVGTENDEETDIEETEPLLSETASAVDIVSQAKELLDAGRTHHSHHNEGTIKKVVQLLKNAAEGSTVVVFGLGPELFVLSQLAKDVIALEFDSKTCQNFLKTDVGSCGMQPNVHIYCGQPSSLSKDADSQASLLDTANPAHGQALAEEKNLGTSMTEFAGSSRIFKLFDALKSLAGDLVHHQFGEVPMSALMVLGEYPVAKALMMQEYVDPSTIIVVRSRMPSKGLKALGDVFRVQASFEEDSSNSYSTKPTFVLQRLFGPEQKGDFWKGFTTSEWALKDDSSHLQLVDEVKEDVLAASSAAGRNPFEKHALGLYFDALKQASKRGMDGDRDEITKFLETLQKSVENKTGVDALLDAVVKFTELITRASATESGLGAYAKLLFDTLGKQDREEDIVSHATISKILLDATDSIASANTLDKLKDSIEDACDLGGQKPHLFLAGLKLISMGLQGDTMANVSPILKGLVKLGGGVDVSALTEYKTG